MSTETPNTGTTESTSEDGGKTVEQGKPWTPPASPEELNRIVESRIARVKAGYSDYDQLKAKATEYDQFKASQLTDTEKAIQEAKAEGAREVTEQFTKRFLESEIKLVATQLQFHDPSDAITALGETGKLVGKNGEIDSDALSKALTELAARKPYLVAGESGPKAATRPRPRRTAEDNPNPPHQKSTAADLMRRMARGD